MPAEITWTDPAEVGASIQLGSDASPGSTAPGAVAFAPDRSSELSDTLTLDVDPAALSARFFIAGTRASVADDDVTVFALGDDGGMLSQTGVMVRVRKNAETLTTAERDRFLRAFVDAGNRNDQFLKYWGLHSDAVNMAHQYAFFSWHRALLLQIEREMQAEDPSVALPYWAFDAVAPNLFSPDFLGVVDAGPNPSIVTYSSTNPLNGLHMTASMLPLTRLRNGSTSVSGSIDKSFMDATDSLVLRADVWGQYHGFAHTYIGGRVGDIMSSPADPLFFLLHANVDRGYAAWQRVHDRFDRNVSEAYEPQGPFNPAFGITFGNFEEDTMWPWDGVDRPGENIAITTGAITMPANPGPDDGIGASAQVGEYLDYLDVLSDGGSQGFCYDDIPMGTGEVSAFPFPAH